MWYTQDQIREIVDYAARKGITVIPEIDLPGHMLGALAAYPELGCTGGPYEVWCKWGVSDDVLCVGKESTMKFLEDVLSEVCELFPGEYFHIGGDETPSAHWKECPECQKLMKDLGIETYAEYQNCFMNRIIDYLESKNRHAIVWNDAASGGNLDKRAIIQYWKEKPAPSVKFLNEGGKAILSPFSYYYFDYDYYTTPLNRVYFLDTNLKGLTEEGKKNIIGLEATVWTEYISDTKRFEEFVFPRIIAVSKAAHGENNKPYKEFLEDVRSMRNELGNYTFCDEKLWTKPRISTLYGWLKFVKERYSSDYIKEQLFG
jgi:hexosaminidase